VILTLIKSYLFKQLNDGIGLPLAYPLFFRLSLVGLYHFLCPAENLRLGKLKELQAFEKYLLTSNAIKLVISSTTSFASWFQHIGFKQFVGCFALRKVVKSNLAAMRYIAFGTLFWVSLKSVLLAQNMVPNAGFENNAPIRCMGCQIDEIHRLIPPWKSLGFFPQPHSKDYEFTPDEVRKGWNAERYQPFRGKGMVAIPFYGASEAVLNGKSGYLTARVEPPLERGRLYELSFWVKIKDNFPRSSADGPGKYDYLKHFGASFANQPFKLTLAGQNLIVDDTPFLLDTLAFGDWRKVRYFIRAQTDLNYIIFGWFQNYRRPAVTADFGYLLRYEYFLDEITVKPADEGVADPARTYNFPNFSLRSKPLPIASPPSSISIYFDFGADTLDGAARLALDDFIKQAKAQPRLVYQIKGHTDSIGQTHQALSHRRAARVRDYLVETGGLPSFRFELSAEGSTAPAADNTSEAGRALNRRADIAASPLKLDQQLYRLASQAALNGIFDTAFLYLGLWQYHADADEQILLLYDPELSALHDDRRWQSVARRVRASFDKYAEAKLAYRLARLYCDDQVYGSIGDDYKAAKGYAPAAYDLDYGAMREKWAASTDGQAQMALNGRIADSILTNSGWPPPERVGIRQSVAIIHAILHSEDIPLHKKHLPLLDRAFREGKLEGKWYATVVDRILEAEQGVQRYGTTYYPSPDDPMHFTMGPLEAPEQVDSLRATVNMAPLRLWEFWVVPDED
jgi:outer membrane protein OmpA-like peptidoglycan-associated protein